MAGYGSQGEARAYEGRGVGEQKRRAEEDTYVLLLPYTATVRYLRCEAPYIPYIPYIPYCPPLSCGWYP